LPAITLWATPTALRFLAVLCAICWATGCEPPSAGRVSRPEKNAIAFIGAGQDDSLWPVLRAGAERYVAEFGVKGVHIEAPRRTSPMAQIALLDTLHGRGFRGACVQVNDARLMAPAIRRLCGQGLRVITMVHDAAEEVRHGFCGLNNAAIGQRLAEATAQALHNAGSVIVLHAGAEHDTFGDRLWAFREALSRHTRVRCYFWLDCQASASEAERLIRGHLERYPNLDAFVTLDDWPLRFLEGKPKLLPGSCKLITFGARPGNWRYLQDGTCAALVEADHRRTGYDALMLCDKAVQHQELIVNRIELPLVVVTTDSLDEFMVDWVAWSNPAG